MNVLDLRIIDEDVSFDQFPGDTYGRRLFEHRLTKEEYILQLLRDRTREENEL